MRRRELILTSVGAIGAWPATLWAQQPAALPLVAAMFINPNKAEAATSLLLRERLQALGHTDGTTIRYLLKISLDTDDLAKAATDLVAQTPRVIFANGDQVARAAAAATTKIPIVAQTDDHIAAGLSDSLAHPTRNVTGVSRMEAELDVKRLELLHRLSPTARRILVLRDPETGDAPRLKMLEQGAAQLGLQLDIRDIAKIADLAGAIAMASADGAEAVLVSGSPLLSTLSAISQIKVAAVMYRVPFMVQNYRAVRAGTALIAYGLDESLAVTRMAHMISRILHGANPADLPIERATTFVLAINLNTARELGIQIPPSFLSLVNEVIE